MLLPTAVDVLRCVERTIETVITPALTGAAERSAAATVGHLLRHVALRIEREGALFAAEIAQLRPLLADSDRMLQHDFAASAEAKGVRAAIAAALAEQPAAPHGYRDLASMAAEVTALRQCVCATLDLIQRSEASLSVAARDIHESFQRYVAWELDNESKLIDPAFEGFGPRR